MNRFCQWFLKQLALVFWNPNLVPLYRKLLLLYYAFIIALGAWNYKILVAVLITQFFSGFGVIEWRLLGFKAGETFVIATAIGSLMLSFYLWILPVVWQKIENSPFGRGIVDKYDPQKQGKSKFFNFLQSIGPFGVFIAGVVPFCIAIAVVLTKILNKRYVIVILMIANALKIASFNWGFHVLFFR